MAHQCHLCNNWFATAVKCMKHYHNKHGGPSDIPAALKDAAAEERAAARHNAISNRLQCDTLSSLEIEYVAPSEDNIKTVICLKCNKTESKQNLVTTC